MSINPDLITNSLENNANYGIIY